MMALTRAQQDIIKATVPVLEEHGVAIATRMYRNLLGENPQLNNIFNAAHQKSGRQPRALAASVLAYAKNINDLDRLGGLVELVCHKHASLYVRPEQYDPVGGYFLGAMGEILGGALTGEVRDAWAAAYGQPARIMIDREAQLHGDEAAEGWKADWRNFHVARKEPESAEITSFYLEPADGKPLPSFRPGQYVAVQVGDERPGGSPFKQARQYSLSDAPRADYFRISVKREDGLAAATDPGHVSNILHDQTAVGDVVSVSAPYGNFFIGASTLASPDVPVVFVAAGVGLTCLLSILNTLAAQQRTGRPVSWIHGARSASVRAFAGRIRSLAADDPNLRTVLFESDPAEGEVEGRDFDIRGRVDPAKLDRERDLKLHDGRTQYFVCGPEDFMKGIAAALRGMGVDGERVHMELYGTSGTSRA